MKVLSTGIGLFVIVAVGGFAYWQDRQTDSASVQEISNTGGDGAQTTYAASDVATHNTASDCWAIINGGVYDLTSWIPRHPGGERAIEGLCGKDGSAAFNSQHGGGETQQAILTDLKVGVVQ